ncbi:MAG TPA: lipocalin-like domain-containing protein, partial [Longimicrobiales bacterium]|nr:lipocalin-like domain-containing protein [Longimicrobiales bacterium]
ELGFQLTFFRAALAPETPELESRWATRQAYLAHFTVTDVAAGRFHAWERYARGAAGLAGATADPLRVWVEDWSLEAEDRNARAGAPESGPREAAPIQDVFPLRLRAATDTAALDLRLERGKPPVLQGERGLSRKGPEPGNASYYYSLTRMPAEGSLVLAADTLRVTGSAWLDREWSTSALSEGVVGWDWFALRLDGGWDVMIYRLRTAAGGASPFSEGVLVDSEGRSERLVWGQDVLVEPTGTWTSPVDGTRYPSGWTVRLPGRGWDLEVEPLLAGQELVLSFRYWEGAVAVRGTGADGAPVEGRGYVELTGYADATAPERGSGEEGGTRPPAPPR